MTYNRRKTCDSCNSKIPKRRPLLLYCDLCSEYKYLKFEKLTESHDSRCIEEIWPINAVRKPTNVKISNDNKMKIKCSSCQLQQ